jgi:hypothetical protein
VSLNVLARWGNSSSGLSGSNSHFSCDLFGEKLQRLRAHSFHIRGLGKYRTQPDSEPVAHQFLLAKPELLNEIGRNFSRTQIDSWFGLGDLASERKLHTPSKVRFNCYSPPMTKLEEINKILTVYFTFFIVASVVDALNRFYFLRRF